MYQNYVVYYAGKICENVSTKQQYKTGKIQIVRTFDFIQKEKTVLLL